MQIQHTVLNGLQDEHEATVIANAGRVGSVTIATNMAGRGTDIAPCPKSLKLGGLHVIATEHSDSARVDRQLIGRAARQGNPGSCQFFVSAKDPLIVGNAPTLAKAMASNRTLDELTPELSHDTLALQRKLESQSLERRKKAVQADTWFDSVRETLH